MEKLEVFLERVLIDGLSTLAAGEHIRYNRGYLLVHQSKFHLSGCFSALQHHPITELKLLLFTHEHITGSVGT